MSERTVGSLARLDELLPLLSALPASADKDSLVETTEALRRAVAAFHMEAIRFRMHGVERLIKKVGDAKSEAVFAQVRHELEEAGFHTRSHAAP